MGAQRTCPFCQSTTFVAFYDVTAGKRRKCRCSRRVSPAGERGTTESAHEPPSTLVTPEMVPVIAAFLVHVLIVFMCVCFSLIIRTKIKISTNGYNGGCGLSAALPSAAARCQGRCFESLCLR